MQYLGLFMSDVLELRKTKRITFNIKERGRQFTGVSRANVNYPAWIKLINSPATQEMVATGGMFGYYGHQLRLLYGLDVPETVIVNGQQVSISPAVRTIELSCDDDGNVTHRQEFLNNPFGDKALENYRAKIGGFSAVNDYEKVDGVIYPTVKFGFDYVLQPNYATNMGHGELMDGVQGAYMRNTLEDSLAVMVDSVYTALSANIIADEAVERAIEAENKLLEMKADREKRLRLQQIKQENMLDGALCKTVDLDEYMRQAKTPMLDGAVTSIEPKPKEKKRVIVENATGWFNSFF